MRFASPQECCAERRQEPMPSSIHARRRAPRPRRPERGVTLIELMIAVSITAVVTVGLLFALRTSISAYETTSNRLRSNREQMSRNQILTRQLGAIIPVIAVCAGRQTSFFAGSPTSLRMVSSYSIAEGFRGYPQIVELQVKHSSSPFSSGGLQLVVTEQPYTGPSSTSAACESSDGGFELSPGGSRSIVLADDLASCAFAYRPPRNPLGNQASDWTGEWNRGNALPEAIKVDMKPHAPPGGGLAAVTVTVPLRVDRDLFRKYVDQ